MVADVSTFTGIEIRLPWWWSLVSILVAGMIALVVLAIVMRASRRGR